MSVSPYIQLLVDREKRAATRAKVEAPTNARAEAFDLMDMVAWHEQRVIELKSAIAGLQGRKNAQALKFRQHLAMHEMTVTYLRRLARLQVLQRENP